MRRRGQKREALGRITSASLTAQSILTVPQGSPPSRQECRYPHYKTIYRAESTASSGKQKSPFRYLTQDPDKSICQPSDITTFRFLDLRSFRSFCAIFSDNLVTVNVCKNVHRNPSASPSTAVAQPQANVRMARTMATWSRSHPIWPRTHRVN